MATLQQDIAGIAATHSPVDERRNSSLDDEKKVGAEPNVTAEQQSESGEEEFRQDGVIRIQAITSAWSYKALIITYILFVLMAAQMVIRTDGRFQDIYLFLHALHAAADEHKPQPLCHFIFPAPWFDGNEHDRRSPRRWRLAASLRQDCQHLGPC